MLPFISVVLPVRNERAMLPQLLDSLLTQNYPADRFEILVVDGRSSDGTGDLIRRRYTRKTVKISVLDNPKRLPSSGRNIGVRAAAGDVLLFLDGHCTLPSPNLLEDTAALLRGTGADCLGRPQPLLAPAATKTGEVIAQARTSWLSSERAPAAYQGQASGFVDPAVSAATYRREVFRQVGLFDESFDACHDVEFNIRVRQAGLRAFTDPRLAVHYQPRNNTRALFQQMLRHGRGRLRLLRKHPDTFSKSQLLPIAVLLSLLLSPLAWMLLPRGAAQIATIPLALFILAVAAASLQMGRRHGFVFLWKAPRIFAAIHCGLAAGWLAEAFTPLKPAQNPAVLEVAAPSLQPQPVEPVRRAA